ATDYPYVYPPDPTVARPPLASHAAFRFQIAADQAASNESSTEGPSWIYRAAMCAEPRNGILYIFMPPVESLEDDLELVAAIEATAEAMDQPVLFEGYEPPRDPRLINFRIPPDPGVIEVNIHPSAQWDELVERTTFLYDAARESRLTTEKFMIDGRHTGTGGGNHFALGGATPHHSPWLRPPHFPRTPPRYSPT